MSQVHLLLYNTNLIKAVTNSYIPIVLAILQAETTFVGDFLRYISPLLNTRDTRNLTKGRNS